MFVVFKVGLCNCLNSVFKCLILIEIVWWERWLWVLSLALSH
jgi:hypothetical protein